MGFFKKIIIPQAKKALPCRNTTFSSFEDLLFFPVIQVCGIVKMFLLILEKSKYLNPHLLEYLKYVHMTIYITDVNAHTLHF